MSAAERAAKAQKQRDQLFARAVDEGLALMLNEPDGRAVIWWLYHVESRADGMAEPPMRAVGLALALKAKQANYEGWLTMLREWETPRMKEERRAEADEEGEA